MATAFERRSGPIVWVVEQAEFDYSPARAYGSEIRPIQAGRLTPNADATWHTQTIAEMRRAFAEYLPGVDFVIPTGKPVRMMLAALVMRERGEVHNLLGWDDRTQRYLVYPLDMRRPASQGLPNTLLTGKK